MHGWILELKSKLCQAPSENSFEGPGGLALETPEAFDNAAVVAAIERLTPGATDDKTRAMTLGLSASQVSSWRRGRLRPTLQALLAVNRKMGIRVASELFAAAVADAQRLDLGARKRGDPVSARAPGGPLAASGSETATGRRKKATRGH